MNILRVLKGAPTVVTRSMRIWSTPNEYQRVA